MPVSPDSASDHTALQERIIELETEQKKLREECQSLGLLYEQAEKRRREEARLLRICHVSADLRGLMQELALFFQDLTECQAVGIRLRLGDDFPYFETRGFPQQFVQSENFLCARNPFGELLRDSTGKPILDCMCGNIISGRFDPDKPFFSARGSFWTNSTSQLLASTSEAVRQARTRNRCNGESYESVALIPLRSRETTYGLFQFNDPHPGRFTAERIAWLEDLVDYVALTLMRHLTNDELRHSEHLLKTTQRLARVGGWEWHMEKQSMFWTDEAYRIHDFDPKEIVNGSPEHIARSAACYRPEDRPVILAAFQRCAASGIPYDLEFPLTTDKGRQIWIRTTAEAVWSDDRISKIIGNIIDITERKQAELRLQENDLALRAILNASPEAIFLMAVDGTIIIANAALAERLRTPLSSLIGSNAFTLLPPELTAARRQQVQTVVETGLPLTFTDQWDTRFVEHHLYPICREDGRVARLAIFAMDISERKLAEEDLVKSERKFRDLSAMLRLMCDNVSDMIWAKDLNKRYIFANKALCRDLLGAADTDEPLGRTDLFFAERERSRHADNPQWHTFGEICRDTDQITMDAGRQQQFDEYGNVQGKYLYLDVRKAPFLDRHGQMIGTVGSARDITAAKDAEEVLRESEERFRTLSLLAPVGIYLCDPAGQCQFANPRWCEMAGMNAEEALGSGWSRGLHPEDRQSVLSAWQQMIESKGQWGLEYRFQTPAGKITWVYGLATPQRDSKGKIIRYIGVNTDITERKQAEEILQATLAEKEILLREVHHRVKNNMAAIIALFELQRQAMADPQAQTVLAELSGRIRSMSLVHEKLYRSESLARINFQEYLQSLISHLRTSFNIHNIRCEVAATGVDVPLDLAVPCGMIVNELVTNALKYAFPPNMTAAEIGDCRIGVSLSRDQDTYTLSVSDNGVGLPADFDWTQARTIGLVLVRMLGQHQLGGTYEVDRRQGTRFTLSFTLRNRRNADD